MKSSRILAAVGVLLGLGAMGVALRGQGGIGETRPTTAHGAHLSLREQSGSTVPPLLDYIPTYYQHVKPILEANCTSCHVQDGIAPFSLTSLRDAQNNHRQIYLDTRAQRMPPFPPNGESPKFKHELRLSKQDIAILANWSWSGAPAGDPKKAVTAASKVARVSIRSDLKLSMPKVFMPKESLSDEYRCFMVNPKLEGERFITGYDILPGNAAVVHHVLMFELEAGLIAEAQRLEREEGDNRDGYTCFGGPRVANGLQPIGAWAPGSPAVKFPEGTGARLRAGSQLLLQVHYNLINGAKPDQSVVKLELAPAGSRLKALLNFAPNAPVELPCPGAYPQDPKNLCHREAAYARVLALNNSSGNRNRRAGNALRSCVRSLDQYINGSDATHIETVCEYPVPANLTLHGLAGHMHYLGKSIKLEINPTRNDRIVLLDIPNWDFHWQGFYWFEQPVVVKPGDTFRITCVFDNSVANQPYLGGKQRKPQYIVWGEGTEEEMCLGYVQTTLN
ncbi:MAG: hypothetical protein ACK41E_07760 [Deinococcales bacterium]